MVCLWCLRSVTPRLKVLFEQLKESPSSVWDMVAVSKNCQEHVSYPPFILLRALEAQISSHTSSTTLPRSLKTEACGKSRSTKSLTNQKKPFEQLTLFDS